MSYEELKQDAVAIRDETQTGDNTAVRIGRTMVRTIEAIEGVAGDLQDEAKTRQEADATLQAEDTRLNRSVDSLSKQMTSTQTLLDAEITARQEADVTLQAEDTRLDRRVSLLVKQMTSVQTMLDSETTAREEADEQLRKLIEAIDVNGGGGGSSGGEDVPSLEAYVIGEVLFLK